MQRLTTRPVPTVTSAVVTPADMLKRAVQLGQAAHESLLQYVFHGAGYILLVSHFKDSKAEGYLSRTAAADYLEEQLEKKLGVSSRQLRTYTSLINDIVRGLTGSAKMFGPTIQECGLAKTPEKIAQILHSWVESVKDRKIESLNGLREAFGYYTPGTARAKPMTAERANNAIERTMDTIIEKGVEKGKVSTSDIGSKIVKVVPDQSALFAGQIEAVTDIKVLEHVMHVAEKRIKELRDIQKKLALTERATAAVKASAKAAGKGNGKTPAKKAKPRQQLTA